MDTIKVRYGESFDLSVQSDDESATTATLFVGKVGQSPLITIPAAFENVIISNNTVRIAYIEGERDHTRIPLGTYKYQFNISYSNGRELKFPTDEECEENGLPEFIVLEALDETEVVS